MEQGDYWFWFGLEFADDATIGRAILNRSSL